MLAFTLLIWPFIKWVFASAFCLLWIMLLWIFVYKFLSRHVFIFLGYILRTKFLDPLVTLLFSYIKNCQTAFQRSHTIFNTMAGYEAPHPQYLLFSVFFPVAILGNIKWYFIAYISMSLMANLISVFCLSFSLSLSLKILALKRTLESLHIKY